MKAHELARELNISHKELLNFLQQRRLTRNPTAPLPPAAIDAARNQFGSTAVAVKVEPNGDRKVQLPANLTVEDLGSRLGVPTVELIKKLIQNRIMATKNSVIDFDTAALLAEEFGHSAEPLAQDDMVTVESEGGKGSVITTSREELFSLAREDQSKLQARPPIVTVLGHVDHGKTSILDAIRQTRVAAGEAGGITQRIGAYRVTTPDDSPVVFIDTPGHEAFTAMRARGAQVTDVAVLVVAADDGVMPQTVEAIQHAKAAKVPIVVAINKIDKDNANIDRVHQELAENDVVTRHYGGEHECVHVSARTGQGLDDLLTTIVLVSEILELKANPNRPALGTVVDAHMERGRGPVATVLVQAGTLRVGDDFVCGHISGRVRALTDDRGERVDEAPPATPVVVSGLDEVPVAGEIFQVVHSEQAARQIALNRRAEMRAAETARGSAPRLTLEELARRTREGELKELDLVVKADAQGSLEAVVSSLGKVDAGEVAVKIVGQGVGAVSDSDLLLASVSNAIIVCFNLRPTQASDKAAERQKVEVRYYDVIYKLIEDVERAAKGLREPVYREVFNGRAEVVMAIKIPGRNIAGCRIQEGRVGRNDVVSLKRGGREIYKGPIDSLKHYKEDVREMREGEECGIGLQGFDEFEPGDLMEAFRLEREEL